MIKNTTQPHRAAVLCFFKVLSIAGKVKLYYNECVFINAEMGILSMDNRKEKIIKETLFFTEYIYLFCFSILTIYAFLKTTTFPSPIVTEDGLYIYFNEFTSVIPFHMEYILISIIVIRYVLLKENRLRDIFLGIIIYRCADYAVKVNLNHNILLFTLLISFFITTILFLYYHIYFLMSITYIEYIFMLFNYKYIFNIML